MDMPHNIPGSGWEMRRPLFARTPPPLCYDQGYRHSCRPCRPIGREDTGAPSFHELELSASSGCPDCQVLQEGISKSRQLHPQAFLEKNGAPIHRYSILQEPVIRRRFVRVHIWKTPYDENEEFDGLEFYPTDGDTVYMGPLVPKHTKSTSKVTGHATDELGVALGMNCDVSSSPGSSECLGKAVALLRECQIRHICHRFDGNQLPLRLLLVSESDTTLQLINTRQNQNIRGYFALSYCWGKSPATMLKISSVKKSQEYRLSLLPAVFQDAVMVTRYLGFRYLWIDALCIAQDDPHEMDEEISRMGLIYANAALTIIAASSSNSNQSFLRGSTGTRAHRQPFHLYKSQDHSIRPDIFVRRSISIVTHMVADKRKQSLIYDHEVDHRGWCFQEHLLSSRILRFNHEGIYFMCKRGDFCEDGRGELLRQYNHSQRYLGYAYNELRILSMRYGSGDLESLWKLIAFCASRRKFSICTDILPSVSGLAAKYVQLSKVGEDYIGGVWKRGLTGLCWFTRSPTSPGVTYIAPSFSWASVGAPVEWERIHRDHGEAEELAKVIDWTCDLAGSNPFGKVRSGHLRLRGPSRQMKITARFTQQEMEDQGHKTAIIPGYDEILDSIPYRKGKTDFVLTKGDRQITVSTPRFFPDYNYLGPFPMEVHMLCLTRTMEPAKVPSYKPVEFHCIVLERCALGQDTFHRIGLWNPYYDSLYNRNEMRYDAFLEGAQIQDFKIV